MRQTNLSGIDLDLLPVLDALLRLRHVTRAAGEVGLSQPAMSRALGRLRHLFGDPLLIRAGGGLALTPMAEDLHPRLSQALAGVRSVFAPPVFDPATEERSVRLAASDVQTVLLVPAIAARLQREAPGLSVTVEAIGPDTVRRGRQGAFDFGFAITGTPLPPGLETAVIGQDRLVVVMRRGHPMAGWHWTLADYGRFPHAVVSIFGDGQTAIDAELGASGLSRRVLASSPHFMAALATVAATDAISTLSAALVRRFSSTFDLVTAPAPLPVVAFEQTLVWDRLRAADPCLIWLRGLIREVAADVFAPLDPPPTA